MHNQKCVHIEFNKISLEFEENYTILFIKGIKFKFIFFFIII